MTTHQSNANGTRRIGVTSALLVALAAGAHVLGGGALHVSAAVIVAVIVAFLITIVTRVSPFVSTAWVAQCVTALAAVMTQWAAHAVFSLMPPAPVHTSELGGHLGQVVPVGMSYGHHAHDGVITVPLPPLQDIHSGDHSSPFMVVTHSAAAMITVWVLADLNRALTPLGALLASLLTALVWIMRLAPLPHAATVKITTSAHTGNAGRRHSRHHHRRGPPQLTHLVNAIART